MNSIPSLILWSEQRFLCPGHLFAPMQKKRSSALLLFHRLKSNPRSLDFDPVFSAGISSPVPIPIPETRLVLTSRVIFLSFLQSEPFSTACLISCREMKVFSSPASLRPRYTWQICRPHPSCALCYTGACHPVLRPKCAGARTWEGSFFIRHFYILIIIFCFFFHFFP